MRFRHRKWIVFFALCGCVGGGWLVAQDIGGARKALLQVQQRVQELVQLKPQENDKNSELAKKIKDLPQKLAELKPASAAEMWLRTYEKWLEQIQEPDDFANSSGNSREALLFAGLVNSLPGPKAWPKLSQLIDERPIDGNMASKVRALSLRMLGHRLVDDTEELKLDISSMKALSDTKKKKKPAGNGPLSFLQQDNSNATEEWSAQLRRQHLSTIQQEIAPLSLIDAFKKELEGQDQNSRSYVSVPDLVSMIGREEATPLLEKALLTDGVVIYFADDQSQTADLARTLARKHLKKLKQPQWHLCHSINAADLYEAFAKLETTGSLNSEATSWYIVSLIINGRGADVVEFLADRSADENTSYSPGYFNLRSSLLKSIEKAGHSRRLYQFLTIALKAHPELPFWGTYVSLASKRGSNDEVVEIVDEALNRDDLDAKTRLLLQKTRADALLADDQIDAAVAQYRTILDSAKDQPADVIIGQWSPFKVAVRIAEIGRLTNNEMWRDIGLDAAEDIIRQDAPDSSHEIASLVGSLCDAGLFARAEQLMVDRIARLQAQMVEAQNADDFSMGFSGTHFGSNYSAFDSLKQLLRVYHLAGRPKEVITLLREAPHWGHKDLAEFLKIDAPPGGGRQGARPKLPISYMAARALADDGQPKLARPIAEALVLSAPSFDPAWELAVELYDDKFPELAMRVFSRDQFEERPIIWLAKYNLMNGSIDESEKLIRQAISIDPSDGEQGRNDRMRAYSILAEILAKKDDQKTALIYRGAMAAIRMAELADQFYVNGMLTRGLKMYRESLNHFADAYCIQSRLAVQLAKQGNFDAAAKHYQRAYELMPDSFGRVESHCFGCEGVFDGDLAQGIAERVFAKLVAEHPENPRVQYLMGYLRSNQNQHAVAANHLRKAVQLDPDYLNAWTKLSSLESTPGVTLTQEEKDAAIFAVLRLDPLAKRGRTDASSVQNLATFWTPLRDNARRVPELTFENLFPLTASQKELEKAPEHDEFGRFGFSNMRSSRSRATFASHATLQAIASLMDEASQ